METIQAIEAVWRIEAPRLIGGLVRFTRDIDLAEDLAQEALVAALEHWPQHGIPDNPGAWLMTTAKRRAIDAQRARARHDRKHAEEPPDAPTTPAIEAALDDNVGDDLLRLILIACHPVVAQESRVALTLRLLGGLTTEEIARAFLQAPTTIQQRIVRAKRTLVAARVPFEVPRGQALAERLASVFEVIYLIFNEGYTASQGEDWLRPALCEEALRLGRILVHQVPHNAEAHGLLALMELHQSRVPARTTPTGEPILLLEQDRTKWDRLLITRGLAALERAETLAQPSGPYTLQAAIVACHARASTAPDTDWQRIVALYDGLVELTQSPVVALNRAVAVSMASGPEAGLQLVEALEEEGALQEYALLPSVKGDFLFKLNRKEEARQCFERAAFLTQNARERALLLGRAAACKAG